MSYHNKGKVTNKKKNEKKISLIVQFLVPDGNDNLFTIDPIYICVVYICLWNGNQIQVDVRDDVKTGSWQ